MAITLQQVVTRAVDQRGTESNNIPSFIPAAGETVYAGGDCMVTLLHLVNPSGSPVTVTITDGNGNAIFSSSLPANSDQVRDFYPSGRYAPGSFRWSASTDGVVVGYVRFRGE